MELASAGPRFEFLMKLEVDVGPLTTMGPAPLGERRVVVIDSGTFKGPRLEGKFLPGGADWQINRSDGVLELDARYGLQESKGGLIRVVSQGYRHGPPEVMARLARGEDVDTSKYFFRTTMRFETGAPHLSWLNKTIAVAIAERKARKVLIEAFALL